VKVINRVNTTNEWFLGYFFTVRYLFGKQVIYVYDASEGTIYDFAGYRVRSRRILNALACFNTEEERKRRSQEIIDEFEKLKSSGRWS
jgi:hypothetical protein